MEDPKPRKKQEANQKNKYKSFIYTNKSIRINEYIKEYSKNKKK